MSADDGTEFVVSVNGKTEAEKLAAEKLAEMGKPAAKFTVTLAQRADAADQEPDDLLSGLDPEPAPEPVEVKPGERPSEAVKRTAAERKAKPDPKPAAKGRKGGTRPDGSKGGTRKAEPTATTKRQPATAAKAKRSTSTAKKPDVGVKALAIEILEAEGGPLHTKVIAERIISSGKASGLKGKTPEATIAAMLAVGAKPGGPFKRTAPGTFDLAHRN